MRRWVAVGLLVVAGLLVVGLILVGVQKQRLNADRLQCEYRLQQLGQFATEYTKGTTGLKPWEAPAADVPQAIPPGTVPNFALTPDQRLSWVCDILPFLDQKAQDTLAVRAQIDRNSAWDSPPNHDVSTTRLNLFVCPGALPELPVDQPAVTQFVGLSGVGTSSAQLPIARSVPARAGCFRYDIPTPLALIRQNDGLSTTYLFAETSNDLGPWIRGGFSTIRGLDVSDGAKPPLGLGGQFGGTYPNVAGFGRADGSVTFVRQSQSAEVLRSHFTIAGGELDGIPGED